MARDVGRICYFAVRDPNYPRNKMLSNHLKDNLNAEIDRVCINTEDGFRKNVSDLFRFVCRSRQQYDAVILAEFSLQFAILGYLLSRRSKAVFVVDFFVGMHETRVEDCGEVSKWSLRALLYYSVDLAAARLGDVCLADNEVRAASIRKKYRLSSNPVVVHVGAPDWATRSGTVRSLAGERPLRVLYYGNYIPLHGIDTFVKALIAASSKLELTVTLIGDGQMRPTVEELVRGSTTRTMFTFLPVMNEAELREYILDHDVVAGVFGDSPKAKSVIANKVWQGLACGAVVLTQRSAALNGVREYFPQLLWECESNIEAVVDSLIRIAKAAPVPEAIRSAASASVKTIVSQGLDDMGNVMVRN